MLTVIENIYCMTSHTPVPVALASSTFYRKGGVEGAEAEPKKETDDYIDKDRNVATNFHSTLCAR